MNNKQKKKLLNSIYSALTLFSVLAVALALYLSIDRIYTGTYSLKWLDIAIICVNAILLFLIFVDSITTKKSKNKYMLARIFYQLFFLSIISIIVLAVYAYYTKHDLSGYVTYVLPIALVMLVEFVFIINFVLGLNLSKLNKSTTVTVDSSSAVPNFNDEVLLKKKLDEANRKLEMKKIQEQIDNIAIYNFAI